MKQVGHNVDVRICQATSVERVILGMSGSRSLKYQSTHKNNENESENQNGDDNNKDS